LAWAGEARCKVVKVGVFDSGVGGKSVVVAIEKAIPDIEVLYETDRENIPYGGKSTERLLELAIPKIQKLEQAGCDVIVVACNTVTTTIIKQVREKIKTPIVAIEPMIKPAAQITKTKKIIVCATPATLTSVRYKELTDQYAKDIEVYEPNCSDWASLIENNAHNQKNIDADITKPLQEGADVVVLACTHYHWIEEEIDKIASKYGAVVIQPEKAIVERLKTVLSQL
jgi:glutamate racemase